MSYNIKNALADFKKEDLADGMIDILKDSTRTLEKTKENGFLKLSLKMQRTSIYNGAVWLDEKNGELVKTACRCGHFQKQYFCCEHVAAVVMQYIVEIYGQDVVKQSDIFPLMLQKTNVEDPFIPGILKSTDEEMMEILKENFFKKRALPVEQNIKQPLSMQAKCCIGECKDGLLLELRVGETRTYVIRDLNEFFYKWTEKKTIELGKYIKFIPDKNLFDENGRKIIQFFLEEYLTEKASGRTNYSYYASASQQVRSVSIFGSRIDSFMDTIAANGVYLLSDEKKNIFYDEQFYSPKIKVAKLTYGATVRAERYHILCESLEYSYVLSGDTIYRMKKPDMAVQKILELCQSKKELFISDKDLPAVARDVLSNLKDAAVITYTGMDPDKYLPPKPTIALYLDSPQENMITCDVAAIYGEKKYHVYGKERYSQKRNFTEEHRLAEIIQMYFNAFDQEKSLLVYSGDEGDIFTFLSQVIPKLQKYGDIYVTDSMKKLRVVPSASFQVGVSVSSGLLEMSMASNQFNKEELAEIFSSYDRKKKYHRLKNGTFITFNEEQKQVMSAISDVMKNYADKKNPDTIKMPLFRALYLDELLAEKESVELKKNREYRKLIGKMRSYENGDYEVPQSLEAVLREYQRDGFYWIKTLKENGFGGILADDMGLGKTIQVIALFEDAYSSGEKAPSLVVCPASLVFNWEQEIQKFAPDLKVQSVVGTGPQRMELLQSIKEGGLGCQVLITSYDLLKRDIANYEGIDFRFQIIDEAQYIKNAATQSARSVKAVNVRSRFALTGTPIENRLGELWSIFDFLMPGFLFGNQYFRREYEIPITKERNEQALERLKGLIGPFILRRVKKDVLKELPDKLEKVVYSTLEEEQKKLYTANAILLKEKLESDDFKGAEKLQILSDLMRLRQICCDPRLCYGNYKAGSAKLKTCMDLIRTGVEGEHKILLFSQFTSMLDLIEEQLKKDGIECYKLTGATPKEERIQMVSRFHQNEVPVFLISLKAGGTGLNLTAADIVIHYDPWWNVAAQNQATDRTHRIGQEKQVMVYKLITSDTIEENILKLQEAKKDLADQIVSKGGISFGELTKDDILKMIEESRP